MALKLSSRMGACRVDQTTGKLRAFTGSVAGNVPACDATHPHTCGNTDVLLMTLVYVP